MLRHQSSKFSVSFHVHVKFPFGLIPFRLTKSALFFLHIFPSVEKNPYFSNNLLIFFANYIIMKSQVFTKGKNNRRFEDWKVGGLQR